MSIAEVLSDYFQWIDIAKKFPETGRFNENAGDLLKEVIERNKDRNIKELQLFCTQKAVKVAQELNFSYWGNDSGPGPGGIVLFEKKLK